MDGLAAAGKAVVDQVAPAIEAPKDEPAKGKDKGEPKQLPRSPS
jgi:hypothetical protein